MKRNFLKTSLSAFAFTMAIVASFAFSPALNDAEDVLVDGYIQQTDPEACTIVTHTCDDTGSIDCTVTLISGIEDVYKIKNGTECSTQMKRSN
jgi:hypothetical protein